jgi:hypothetical protein
MTTKEVLLLVGGVALGYFLSTKKFGQRTSTGLGEVFTGVKDTATGLISDVAEVGKDTIKMAECEKKLIEQTSTMKLSQEAQDSFRKTFLADCMAK